MIGKMVAQLQEHLGPRMSHVQMGDSGICLYAEGSNLRGRD